MHSRALYIVAFGGILTLACGGSTDPGRFVSVGQGSGGADTAGAQYEGNGVQCGALVCSGTQQCCLVYIAADASTSNPTHACDQNCESVCADTCPDAGGQTSMMPPPGGMAMPGMPGMGKMGGGDRGVMPEGGMEAPAGPMGGPTGSGMAGPGGPAGGAPEDAGEQ